MKMCALKESRVKIVKNFMFTLDLHGINSTTIQGNNNFKTIKRSPYSI